MKPVTWEEIRDWLADRDPWPREILKAIARAADRDDYDQVSANDLRRDPDFVIAENQVNIIPSIFGLCGRYGWLHKIGYVTSTSAKGHQCEVKLYGVTPEGRAAFERIVEIGAGDISQSHSDDGTSPPVASPDLGASTPDRPGSRSPSGTLEADPDGGAPAPSGLPSLPGISEPEEPGYLDPDQRKAA